MYVVLELLCVYNSPIGQLDSHLNCNGLFVYIVCLCFVMLCAALCLCSVVFFFCFVFVLFRCRRWCCCCCRHSHRCCFYFWFSRSLSCIRDMMEFQTVYPRGDLDVLLIHDYIYILLHAVLVDHARIISLCLYLLLVSFRRIFRCAWVLAFNSVVLVLWCRCRCWWCFDWMFSLCCYCCFGFASTFYT